MPKLDPEIKERIDGLMAPEHITRAHGKVLKAYFEKGSIAEGAAKLDMQISSFYSVIKKLKQRNVLEQVARGKYVLATDESRIVTFQKVEFPSDPPLSISPEEKEWMLKNYPKYRGKRSEVARILGRSKLDICRMAIELRLDQKISK
ncbi:hypothetical protein [Paenibacillus sp. USDA918EY]|uniref:hypothetical protein n=1 Tax=Paenibacillus sp. USDA918EY TaxID=2689575 RepID=UPI001359DCE1|nr:hypothetical protein [Paenibacillus sp. USDA918EY]